MKTKNNVQKTGLRVAAVIVSLVLLSYTVSAQEFWKRLLTNSSFGEIAIAMVETDKSSVSINELSFGKATFKIETETEPALVLENWMKDDSNFGGSTMDMEVADEPALEMEPWMTDQELFVPVTDNEPALQLETWMVSENVWGN